MLDIRRPAIHVSRKRKLPRQLSGLVCAALILCSGSVASAQLTPESLIGNAISGNMEKYADVQNAITRFNNGDVVGAQLLLENVYRNNPTPKLPPPNLMLAKMFFLANQLDSGRAALELVAREHPDDPEAYIIDATLSLNERRMIAADALYDKAISLLDSFDENLKRKRDMVIRARSGRTALAEMRQDWPAAEADLTAWLKEDPENAAAHHRLGRALFMQRKFQPGYQEFVEAKKKDDSLAHPLVTAAVLYHQLGETATAKTGFERAVQEDGANEQTLGSYVQWLIQTGDIAKAQTTLAEARRIAPQSFQIQLLSGVAAKMAGDLTAAEDYFVEALKLSPSNRDVLNQLALLLIAQEETEKQRRALEFARINNQLHGQEPEVKATLAWVLYNLNQLADANVAFNEALRGNRNSDTNYFLARMLHDQGKLDAAKQLLEAALKPNAAVFVHRAQAQELLDRIN